MLSIRGPQLWNRAKQIIPGGSKLLSKRSEMFLPDQWPSYYRSAKGIDITDLDGNNYKDFSIMGIGSCILGYADDDVNNAVKKAIDNGSMSTLNCPEEVELAEKLLKIDPWAGMVRFARTGGESMAIAVRIARAYSKKTKVAFCGYHGWHDWYLAANLKGTDNLKDLLLPGLNPIGIPKELKSTSIPFHHNNLEELESIVKANPDIGAIIIEPIRHEKPKEEFLKGVREIANRMGAVLIFDEITSAWRETIGGVYRNYGTAPDIVVYGKAMGNGYPCGAIVGKSEIMDIAQETFISSTFWTERIGSTAALATIDKLKEKKVPEHIVSMGHLIDKGWKSLANEHELKISTMPGFLPLPAFKLVDYENSQEILTLFTQIMLDKGYLASKQIYLSYAHNEDNISRYFDAVNEAFSDLKKAIDTNSVKKELKGPVAHTGFARLTN